MGLELVESLAQVGSGALPVAEMPSRAVAVESSSIGVESLARRLRHEGVVGRSAQDRLLLDMRTVRDEELAWIAQALAGATEP